MKRKRKEKTINATHPKRGLKRAPRQTIVHRNPEENEKSQKNKKNTPTRPERGLKRGGASILAPGRERRTKSPDAGEELPTRKKQNFVISPPPIGPYDPPASESRKIPKQ